MNYKNLFKLCSFFLILLFSPSLQAKESLMVKDLTPQMGINKQMTTALSEIIRNTIARSGKFNVQSLDDMAAVSKIVEEKLKLGCDDTKCLIELAGALGTNLVVAGSLSKFGTLYTFSLRLISSHGKDIGVIKRESEKCKCTDEELISVAERLARKLIGKKIRTVTTTTVPDVISRTEQTQFVDATTRATETWLYKDYLNFSAGEGIESNKDTKNHIIGVLGGKKKKNTYVLATCINNVPLATTFDAGIDPDKMTMYIFSEKGTEKISHMRTNPRVSIGWHHATEFGKTLCMQMRGTAEVIDNPRKYDEGLATYPYEEFADVRGMDRKRFANEVMKKFMTMTKVTLNQIMITDSQYSQDNKVRVHQIWKRRR